MTLVELTPYGGITVMLPAAIVVGVWLCFCGSRRPALLWLATMLSMYVIVGLSKILFKGWGIGLHSLNVAVISGHAMHTCLVLTVVLSLLARQINPRLRWPAAGLGLIVGWWFAMNCVFPFIHPLQEAIAGAVLGSLAACAFLYSIEGLEIRKIPLTALVLGLVFMAFNTTTPKHTAENVLNRIAVTISGAQRAFKQPEWRQPEVLQQLKPSI
ncbi:hypothetical protein [Pseudomonas sp.]|uniref:hypothetical protein n=1 Tax=Pseudomonas sp. TaxID=306 RepID=UPI00262201DC|nr:hypothetical protein [Pseudomonas sp.]